MTLWIEETKYNNIWFNWPNIVSENDAKIILRRISSLKIGWLYKSVKFSAAPISGNVINQIQYLEIPENNFRYVDKCCTAGLGTSKIWSFCCCANIDQA